MEALRDLWPDDDRRDDALLRIGCDVLSYEENPLTPTQARVLEALSRGLGYDGTADVLGMGIETVKTHAKGARLRLRAKNTAHACCEALRLGLIR